MRLKNNHLILVGYLLLLSGCITMPASQAPHNVSMSWPDRAQQLSKMNHWHIKGAMGIQTKDEASSASFDWQQDQENYQIRLFGPLGAGAIDLAGGPELATLKTSDGQQHTAASAEKLLLDETGWQLPISNLYYWIRGLPLPKMKAQIEFDEFNHISNMKQQGWSIKYLNYTAHKGIDLPSKLTIENIDLKVKIIISRWQ